jgi:hypothetical protein
MYARNATIDDDRVFLVSLHQIRQAVEVVCACRQVPACEARQMRRLRDLTEIEGLQEKIDRWREGRPKRLMPEELWRGDRSMSTTCGRSISSAAK